MLPITGYSINHLTRDIQCLLLTLHDITKIYFLVAYLGRLQTVHKPSTKFVDGFLLLRVGKTHVCQHVNKEFPINPYALLFLPI